MKTQEGQKPMREQTLQGSGIQALSKYFSILYRGQNTEKCLKKDLILMVSNYQLKHYKERNHMNWMNQSFRIKLMLY